MTLGLFTNMAPMGSQKHMYIYVPSSGERFSPGLHCPVLTGSSLLGTLHIPSGGIEILTNSPFTPTWDASSVRPVSGMRLVCRVSLLWLAYLTRSPPCGQHVLSIFNSLPDLVVAALDVLRPGMIQRILRMVDDTLTVAVEPVFILPNT